MKKLLILFIACTALAHAMHDGQKTIMAIASGRVAKTIFGAAKGDVSIITPLFMMVMTGDVSAVQKLIERGEDPLETDYHDNPIIFYAIINGDLPMVQFLWQFQPLRERVIHQGWRLLPSEGRRSNLLFFDMSLPYVGGNAKVLMFLLAHGVLACGTLGMLKWGLSTFLTKSNFPTQMVNDVLSGSVARSYNVKKISIDFDLIRLLILTDHVLFDVDSIHLLTRFWVDIQWREWCDKNKIRYQPFDQAIDEWRAEFKQAQRVGGRPASDDINAGQLPHILNPPVGKGPQLLIPEVISLVQAYVSDKPAPITKKNPIASKIIFRRSK